MSTELEKLRDEVEALSPPDRLRLAADLMDNRRGDLAHIIAQNVVLELGAAIALRRLQEPAARTPPKEGR